MTQQEAIKAFNSDTLVRYVGELQTEFQGKKLEILLAIRGSTLAKVYDPTMPTHKNTAWVKTEDLEVA